MDSIVLELQKEALDTKIRTVDLLRRALVVAKKLNQLEFQDWIENELKGYDKNENVPEYRQVIGQIKYFNPYHGWQPVFFGDTEVDERSRYRTANMPLAMIDEILPCKKENQVIEMPLPASFQQKLREGTGLNAEMTFIVSESQFIKITDAVRNIILNWSLKLEEQGILGEGLTFSEKEKEAAKQTPQNINNFYAPVQNPQIQQGNITATQTSNQTIDLNSLRAFISEILEKKAELNLEEDKEAEIDAEIGTIKSQLDSPKPKKGIILESLTSIRTILEGAGSSIAAQLLIELGKAGIGL